MQETQSSKWSSCLVHQRPLTDEISRGSVYYQPRPTNEVDLTIRRANQVWALDTTYIPMARGFVYLTAVVDVASRMDLAHKIAIALEACHAKETIEQALAR